MGMLSEYFFIGSTWFRTTPVGTREIFSSFLTPFLVTVVYSHAIMQFQKIAVTVVRKQILPVM